MGLGTTSMGMQPNVAAGVSYIFGWLSGLIFFLMEKQNKFVRFHAWQSVIVFGGLSIAWFIALSSIVFSLLAFVVILPLSAVLWLVLMFKAYHGVRFKVPFAGEMAALRE